MWGLKWEFSVNLAKVHVEAQSWEILNETSDFKAKSSACNTEPRYVENGEILNETCSWNTEIHVEMNNLATPSNRLVSVKTTDFKAKNTGFNVQPTCSRIYDFNTETCMLNSDPSVCNSEIEDETAFTHMASTGAISAETLFEF